MWPPVVDIGALLQCATGAGGGPALPWGALRCGAVRCGLGGTLRNHALTCWLCSARNTMHSVVLCPAPYALRPTRQCTQYTVYGVDAARRSEPARAGQRGAVWGGVGRGGAERAKGSAGFTSVWPGAAAGLTGRGDTNDLVKLFCPEQTR